MRMIPTLACAALLTLTAAAPAQYYPPGPQYPGPGGNAVVLVQSWYRQFLNRNPDPNGIATWTSMLQTGSQPQYVLAGILGSEEYYLKAGFNPQGFVRNLFLDVLGREPTFQELNYWLQRATFEDRATVAYAFLMQTGPGQQGGIPGPGYQPNPLGPIWRR